MDEATAAVLERINTFIPKQRLKSETLPSPKGIEITSLSSLTADETEVSSFDFYFTGVRTGRFKDKEELNARLAQKLDKDGDLLNERGDFVRQSTNFIRIPTNERFKITDRSQVEVLNELTIDFAASQESRNNNEQAVTGLNFYVNSILQGKIVSQEELKARLAQRIDRDGDLQNERGDFIRDSRNEIVRVPVTERFAVTNPQQVELVLTLFNTRAETRNEILASDAALRTFDLYSNKILSGSLTNLTELKSRMAQRIDKDGDLLDERGELLRKGNRDFIRVDFSERLAVKDPKQAQLFVDIYEFVNNVQIPTELRVLLAKYLKTGKADDLNRMRVLMSENFKIYSEPLESIVSRFDSTKRQVEFKKQFYTQLLGNNPVDEAFTLLTTYRQADYEDTLFITTLQKKALDVRRAKITQQFTSSLARSNRNFDQTLTILGQLEQSKDPVDNQTAQTLRTSLYRLELTIYRDELYKQITLTSSFKDIQVYLDGLTIRPAVGNFDYIKYLSSVRERAARYYSVIEKINRLRQANKIRRIFSGDPNIVLLGINTLPEETVEDAAVKSQLLGLYKNYLAANKPADFDSRFRQEIESRIEAQLKQIFESPQLGRNKEAFNYLRENFLGIIFPLVESLRDDPRTKKIVEKFLTAATKRDISPRLQFIQKQSELEKGRPLTDAEKTYIQSVELLTLFNPYLLAVTSAEYGVTLEYLKHYFDVLSAKTQEQITDGAYYPLLQLGTGPNGLAAFGEIVRNNPELARQSLVIDKMDMPGGPFGIPNGPAWGLNSANYRGMFGYSMPDLPPRELQYKTVRSFGSPVARWYPGERSNQMTVRYGSINTTVDYLPTPDNLSLTRYSNNEQLWAILGLQASMLFKNLSLKTELVKVEPNPNQNEKGNKIATLKITDESGNKKLIKIKTDAVFVSSGLGEPTYGFKLPGSKAEKVIQQTVGSDGFPKISTTLEAFKAFSNRVGEKKPPGRTVVIWGNGNSTDTLLEFIGTIFQGDNPLVKEITKIYIISEGDLSARPRYAAINDLRPRNGTGNLIEQVRARVSDVDFATLSGPIDKRELVFLGQDGQPIKDSAGKIIMGDSGIAATGFNPELEKIFESYLGGRSLREEGPNSPIQPIVLPTNTEVSVADAFKLDPSIVFLGTASNPGFNSFEKLAQLPVLSREALLRNGVDNAVAIGFRAPDTQAAVNIWLNSREVNLDKKESEEKPQVPLEGIVNPETQIEIEKTIDINRLNIPDNVPMEELLLSPLLASILGNRFDLSTHFTGGIDFNLTYDRAKERFLFKFVGGDAKNISTELLRMLQAALADEYFQRYALSLLNKRRRNPNLDINISFKKGVINPKNTYVQTM